LVIKLKDTLDIYLNSHSFKFVFRLNSHLEMKDSRINNCDFILRKKM